MRRRTVAGDPPHQGFQQGPGRSGRRLFLVVAGLGHRQRYPLRGEAQHLDRSDRAARLSGAVAAGRAVRSGHERRAEPHRRGRVALEVGGARGARQVVGVRDAQDGPGFVGGERLQTDPVRQVTVQSAQPALVEPLRGQQQMDVQGPAEPADGDEQFGELRFLRQQFGELVDDDEQRRQRRQRRTGPPRLLVLADVGEVPGAAQQFLAPVEFPGERVGHPVDHGQLLLQVGDQRGHVAGVQAQEGGAALEVDEHQVQLVRRVGGDQRQHQGPQELALAAAGGTDAQPVRAHASVGALFEVQVHRGAVGGVADRHPQPVLR